MEFVIGLRDVGFSHCTQASSTDKTDSLHSWNTILLNLWGHILLIYENFHIYWLTLNNIFWLERASTNQQWLFGNKYLIKLKFRCDHYFKLKIEILFKEKCHCLSILLPIHEGPGYHWLQCNNCWYHRCMKMRAIILKNDSHQQ